MNEYTEKFDARGLNCPLPIIRTKKMLATMESGQILYIVSTDSSSVKNFQAFCKQTGNALIEESDDGSSYHFYVQKA